MASALCDLWLGCFGGIQYGSYRDETVSSLQFGCSHAEVMVSQLPSRASAAVVVSTQHLSRQDQSRLPGNEKRIRNRSLCSLLCTPPPYPGYSAVMTTIKSLGTLESGAYSAWRNCRSTSRLTAPPSAPVMHNSTTTTTTPSSHASSRPTFCLTPDCDQSSPIGENKSNSSRNTWGSPRKNTIASKESSGYGSASSESDPENDQSLRTTEKGISDDAERASRGTNAVQSRIRSRKLGLEKSRRRSVPAYLREAFSDEIFRVLEVGGVLQFETDADTGMSTPVVTGHSVNRPESVLQLARKFAEASAVQDNRLFASTRKALGSEGISCKSRSGPTTPVRHPGSLQNDTVKKPGGIACLSLSRMSRVNVFKQFDQANRANVPQLKKPFNPSSIKEALLRWCQHKLQGYPVNVTNFSSSWADGMAFCALIHRFAPEAFDFNMLDPRNRRGNFELAFKVAEDHGVVPLLEVDDMLMMGDRPDWKCVFTYVQTFYKEFKDRP